MGHILPWKYSVLWLINKTLQASAKVTLTSQMRKSRVRDTNWPFQDHRARKGWDQVTELAQSSLYAIPAQNQVKGISQPIPGGSYSLGTFGFPWNMIITYFGSCGNASYSPFVINDCPTLFQSCHLFFPNSRKGMSAGPGSILLHLASMGWTYTVHCFPSSGCGEGWAEKGMSNTQLVNTTIQGDCPNTCSLVLLGWHLWSRNRYLISWKMMMPLRVQVLCVQLHHLQN